MLFKNLIFLAASQLAVILSSAQSQTAYAQKATGHIKTSEQHSILQFLRGFHELSDTKAMSLAKTTAGILNLVCSLPQFSPPVGFNVEANVAAEDIGLSEKEPRINAYCYLRYLENETATGKTKQSLDGADIYFKINDFGFFSQMGNYWQDCDHANYPLFFEEPVITDSTKDYMEIDRQGTKVRFVCANQKPLLIALTRKEFIQFLIARKNYQIKDDQKTIQDLQKTIKEAQETLSHPPTNLTEPVKKALSDGITTQENQIKSFQERIKEEKEKDRQYQEIVNSMSSKDASSPARMDYDKKSDELMGGIEQLVPVGSEGGVSLVHINPDYYNYSPKGSAAQFIVIYYTWPSEGNGRDLNYLQQATVGIFNQLNYHDLKMTMQ